MTFLADHRMLLCMSVYVKRTTFSSKNMQQIVWCRPGLGLSGEYGAMRRGGDDCGGDGRLASSGGSISSGIALAPAFGTGLGLSGGTALTSGMPALPGLSGLGTEGLAGVCFGRPCLLSACKLLGSHLRQQLLLLVRRAPILACTIGPLIQHQRLLKVVAGS